MLDTQLPPISPTPEEEELCKKVDDFFGSHLSKTRSAPSKLIKGALFAMRAECRSNDDWRSQASNSLREVLYPLTSPRIGRANPIKLFNKYASDGNRRQQITNKDFVLTFNILSRVNGMLNDLTHHGIEPKTLTVEEYEKFSDKDFDELFKEFKNILLKILSLQQIFMHGIVDAMVLRKRKTSELRDDLQVVLGFNFDARSYFFAKADEKWLIWLWEGGFLDEITQKSDDPTQFRHSLPELNYLDRVAKNKPAEVVKVILQTDLANNFNPEVIDRFVRICADLNSIYLKQVVPKIANENWIRLLGRFNFHGFEYKKMLDTLHVANDHKSLLVLSRAILSIKSRSEMDTSDRFDQNPFCLGDLSYSGVFNHITQVDDLNAKDALAVAIETLCEALSVMNSDEYFFMEDNVFTLSLQDQEGSSSRGGVRNLMAVVKILADRLAEEENEHVIGTISKLPSDSAIARRLLLYAITLKPSSPRGELKTQLFSVFDADDPGKVTMGAEYDTVLQKCFNKLNSSDREEYIVRAIDLPNKCTTEKERKRYKNIVTGLFPHIAEGLTATQRKKIEDAGYIVGEKTEPRTVIGETTGGMVVSKGPVTQEEFDVISVKNILAKLSDKWSPAELEKISNPREFLNPLDAEGVGNLIRSSMTKRFQEFTNNASFFWADNINKHYTYSFLRGTEEVIKNHPEQVAGTNWDQVLNLLKQISNPAQKDEQEDTGYRGWLADTRSVLSVSANVIEAMLRKQNNPSVINFEENRKSLLFIIRNLLRQPYPSPEQEDYETATMTVTSNDTGKLVSSPFSMAINSVRGGAFQAFILFIARDESSLRNDVKNLFEEVLENENTRAMFFMFGHYLSVPYYGDNKWLVGLLPKIFRVNNKKLNLAAWEGYISANVYKELFSEIKIQELYEKGLSLNKSLDPQREFFRDPEEGIAVHFALAYFHFNNFGTDNELFRKFWIGGTEKQHAEFIDFIGRKYISSEGEFEDVKDRKRLLISLWDYILVNCRHQESLIHFGTWINDDKDMFDKKWLAIMTNETLEKTGGALYWDYGLKKSIIKLAEASAKDALAIIKKHLLDYGVNTKGEHRPIFFETEWSDALRITYSAPDTKSETAVLINALIKDGGSQFWPLKEIIEERK